MSYPVHYIHSDMRGAPVLSGTRGTLIALLDAFLVTGFGQVTANSVEVAGGVATASLQPGQGFSLHANIQVAGATPAALNGVSRVIEATETSVKFPTDAPDGVATGTITIKVAPVGGWQKVNSATNKAVFRSTDTKGARHYLRIDETGTATFARVRGFEAMTTIDAGTGMYPTNALVNGGGYWSKSTQANATPVVYDLIADSRFFLLRICPGGVDNPSYDAGCFRGFGDPLSLSPSGDVFASCLSCGGHGNTSSLYGGFETASSPPDGSCYGARTLAGTGGAVILDTKPFIGNASAYSGSDGFLGPYPSPVDGQLKFSQRFLFEGNPVPRAIVPGLLHVPQSDLLLSPIQPRDYVEGAGTLAGRTLVALPAANHVYNGRQGMVFVDITGPWR